MRSPSVAMPVASRLLAQRVRPKFFNLTQHAQGHRLLAGGLSLSGTGCRPIPELDRSASWEISGSPCIAPGLDLCQPLFKCGSDGVNAKRAEDQVARWMVAFCNLDHDLGGAYRVAGLSAAGCCRVQQASASCLCVCRD